MFAVFSVVSRQMNIRFVSDILAFFARLVNTFSFRGTTRLHMGIAAHRRRKELPAVQYFYHKILGYTVLQ